MWGKGEILGVTVSWRSEVIIGAGRGAALSGQEAEESGTAGETIYRCTAQKVNGLLRINKLGLLCEKL